MTIELTHGFRSDADALVHQPFPEYYAGPHLLTQLVAGPATAAEVAEHQHWLPGMAVAVLDCYVDGRVLVRDDEGRYALNMVWFVDVADMAWPRREWETADEAWCETCPVETGPLRN